MRRREPRAETRRRRAKRSTWSFSACSSCRSTLPAAEIQCSKLYRFHRDTSGVNTSEKSALGCRELGPTGPACQPYQGVESIFIYSQSSTCYGRTVAPSRQSSVDAAAIAVADPPCSTFPWGACERLPTNAVCYYDADVLTRRSGQAALEFVPCSRTLLILHQHISRNVQDQLHWPARWGVAYRQRQQTRRGARGGRRR